MGMKWLDNLAIRAGGALVHAHHARLAWSVDISIQQADAAALLGQRNREVR